MKNVMLIISMLLVCCGVSAQTAKNVGKVGAVVTTVKAEERPEVLIETTMGNIRVALYNETPLHRDNFLKLIREYHYYDSLLFHRVIPDFMIQAGDPSSKNAPKGARLEQFAVLHRLRTQAGRARTAARTRQSASAFRRQHTDDRRDARGVYHRRRHAAPRRRLHGVRRGARRHGCGRPHTACAARRQRPSA